MIRYSLFIILLALFTSCSDQKEKMRIIMDTDANNELDDQHALAYLLANDDYFDIEGITVNTTSDGKEYTDIDLHYDEAQRIITLMNKEKRVKIYKGATQSFLDIRDKIGELEFDGFDAVNFIIDRAKATGDRLVLLPIGKLTNIALALLKEPSIIPNIRIVWLGSNYPNPGEYNQDNDPSALQYILGTNVDFEIAIVRYGEPSGTDAVKVYVAEIEEIGIDNNNISVKLNETVVFDEDLHRRQTITTSACGICGKESLTNLHQLHTITLNESFSISSDQISKNLELLNSIQPLFEITGGTHAAVAFDNAGNIVISNVDM